MTNVYPGHTTFTRSGDDFDATLVQLPAFLKANPPETDYVVYAEFLGKPQTGVRELRTALADRQGAVLWKETLRPGDAAFDRAKPNEPMTCCVLVVDRLYGALKIPQAKRRAVTDGRMAQLWEAKSGMPKPAEREAMKPRLAAFKHRTTRNVTVLPVLVNNAPDAKLAAQLAEELKGAGLCVASAAEAGPTHKPAPTTNEQKRLWEFARAVREFAADKKAEYVLCADYLLKPDGEAHSVHFVLCDAAGDWVIVDYQNSHHDDFQRLSPKTAPEANRLVVERLKGYLK
jgi:hypothetical protein